ncbi:beta-ketoacyl synthase N-terminal-like domain-containing protein [Streptomyces enissocaesilis]|uniref:Ketosynthase family 3 (KS3) domain-containing protein n=1 Tax=Streptomyces enissocaesilis TaxID=332589 RepID=A0ABP6J4D7_9ACTN
MSSAPIAIVGRGCVLPGALDPGALWRTVVSGASEISPLPQGHWGLDPAALRSPVRPSRDRVCNDVGGYVRDFDKVFRPCELGWSHDEASRFSPLFRWTAHAVGEALAPVPEARDSSRSGLVMGNLSYPTVEFAQLVMDRQRTGQTFVSSHGVPVVDPRNAFCFGQPAAQTARLFGLGAGALTLDAACASSLYAVKIACDRLQDDEADVMVAGGASCADNLFIHMGFTALSVLSLQGRSRPLDQAADGLVPAEGAAFVTLVRLADALAGGLPVLGVVRGIGWANNGRRGSFVAPDEDVQDFVMRQAYRDAELAPEDVGLLEFHATGTPSGDGAEIRSTARVFADASDLPIGAAKANFGHTLTASGLVGLLKLTAALEEGVIPPVCGVRTPSRALRNSPFRLPSAPEPWKGPRLAGLSAFGFGGNNAHLVLEGPPARPSVAPAGISARTRLSGAAYPTPPDATDRPRLPQQTGPSMPTEPGDAAPTRPVQSAPRAPHPVPACSDAPQENPPSGGPPEDIEIAVVGLGARLAGGRSVEDLVRRLVTGDRRRATLAAHVELSLQELHFPPADYTGALPHQALLMGACQEAAAGVRLPRERTLVLVGAEGAPETASFRQRWNALYAGDRVFDTVVAAGADFATPDAPTPEPLTANAVLRHTAATLANQINVSLDLTGCGFAMSDREASGLTALRLAARSIRAGESDAAIIGAVATPDEPVHRDVLAALGRPADPVDAAVVLVLKRADHAARDGDRVLALLPAAPSPASGAPRPPAFPAPLTVGDVTARQDSGHTDLNVSELVGHADCAHALVSVAIAVICLDRATLPRPGAPACPWLGERSAEVVVRPAEAAEAHRLRLRAAPSPPRACLVERAPRLHVYRGTGTAALLDNAAAYHEGGDGLARLVVRAQGENQLRERVGAASRWLREGGVRPAGVHYREKPLEGSVAFVYTGGAASYPEMGRALMLALPDSLSALAQRCGRPLGPLVQWLFDQDDAVELSAMQRIWAATTLSVVHTSLTRDTLGLRPRSVIGYSSGATSALISLGYWQQLGPLIADSVADPLFSGALTGPCSAVRAQWRRKGIAGERWATHVVGAPRKQVEEALAGEEAVHLTAVNSPQNCTIGGEEAGCARVLKRLRPRYAFRLEYDVAAHAPEVKEVAATWRAFHHRPLSPLPDVSFYTCATDTPQIPTADSLADALTAQATGTVEFAGSVLDAHARGTRVFVEHGPKQVCTNWIGETLRGKDHLAVAMDASPEKSFSQAFDVAAQLVAAGFEVDHEALTQRLSPPPTHLAAAARTILVSSGQARPQVGDRKEGRGAGQSKAHASAALSPRKAVLPSASAKAGPSSAAGPVSAGAPAVSVPPVSGPAGPDPAPAVQDGSPAVLFDRAQLEYLAEKPVSHLFGSRFRAQDGRRRQTRLPKPPMLLVDRVTSIEAEPATMGTGVIWTQTDVTHDSWYLDPAGRMSPALMVEAGQADLLLISWLGVNLGPDDGRVYRLLGCDLTFHGPLPRPGETLTYRIEITGHAEHAGVRLFFFQYDCWVGDELRISVRNGQAGFFTDAELEQSAGVLWQPSELPRAARTGPLPPTGDTVRRFSAEQVRAFALGSPADCFGSEWEITRTHLRTPRINGGDLQLLHEVTDFAPRGGPTGAGYLRAELDLTQADWFFEGHFHEDPCMPGTLMLEGGYQAMAFHLAALGLTASRDGWRFEPVQEETSRMRCRGQAVPANSLLVYELFVTDLEEGPEPVLRADLLCTVDGRPSFHAASLALRLVPDTPLAHWRGQARALPSAQCPPMPVDPNELARVEPEGTAYVLDGTALDREYMLGLVWGSARQYPGPAFVGEDDGRRIPRLPGPPYLCVDRVVALGAQAAQPVEGSWAEAEFELRADAWYWKDSGTTLPTAILMEAALQPCGWLAQFTGCAPDNGRGLYFRNLDGATTLLEAVPEGTRTLRTRVELTGHTVADDMVLTFFDIECRADGVPVLNCTTSFGYLADGAFESASGLPAPPSSDDAESQPAEAHSAPAPVDLTTRPEKYCGGPLRIGHSRLVVPQRATHRDTGGGAAGLGSIRGEKDVRADDWYFRAHFFQDPVQPGSLGVEGLYQLLRVLMIDKDFGAGMRAPRFEAANMGKPLTWKYRGQVGPASRHVVFRLEITETGETAEGRYAVANGWLGVDGVWAYRVDNITLRVTDTGPRALPRHFSTRTLDPAVDTWLRDHRPTCADPSLPATVIADVLASAAERHTGRTCHSIETLTLERWVVLDGPRHLMTEVRARREGTTVELLVWREAGRPALSRYERVARAEIRHEPPSPPAAPPSLSGTRPVLSSPYTEGHLFHGPAFRSLVGLRMGDAGSSGVLDTRRCKVPAGTLHPGLLDGALHVVPFQKLELWDPRIPSGHAGYPRHFHHLRRHAPVPSHGALRTEARYAGLADDDPMRPLLDLWLYQGRTPLVTMRLELRMMGLGRLAAHSPEDRLSFLRGDANLPGEGISEVRGTHTVLTDDDLRALDWFPHTLTHAFGLADNTDDEELPFAIALREHVARHSAIHPRLVTSTARAQAHAPNLPMTTHHLSVRRRGTEVRVRDAAPPSLDLARPTAWWAAQNGPDWPALDLLSALLHGFLGGIRLSDELVRVPRPPHGCPGPGRVYAYGPDHEPAALVLAAANSALRGQQTLLPAPSRTARGLLRLLFDGPGTRTDLRRCPCASDRAPLARRALTHLAHGGDIVLPAGLGRTGDEGSEAVLTAAVRAGVPVHPVCFRPVRSADGLEEHVAVGALRVAATHHVAAPCPAGTVQDVRAGLAAALSALALVPPPPALVVSSALDDARAHATRHPSYTGMDPDDSLLLALVRGLPRPRGTFEALLTGDMSDSDTAWARDVRKRFSGAAAKTAAAEHRHAHRRIVTEPT